MNIEKIGPLPADKGKQKVSEKSEPDSDQFKEMMKVGQSREVDFDEQGKRRLFSQEEEEEKPSTPSASDIFYYHEQAKDASPYESGEGRAPEMRGNSSPESPNFYSQASKKKISPEKEKQMGYMVEKELKQAKKEITSEELEALSKEEKAHLEALSKALEKGGVKLKGKELRMEKERLLSEEAKKIKEAPFFAPRFSAEETKEKEIKVEEKARAKKADTIKKEEKKEKIVKQKTPPTAQKKEVAISKKEEMKKEIEPSIPYQTLELSAAVQAQAEEIAAKLQSNLNPEIVPLLEHMIGAMIQFTNKDVSETQILLNNPKFANSRFYNSRITFEKYATAPNSYNIKLTGSQEAVTIFNENIEGLYKKLSTAELDFEIGQLTAEYERPLFRRKAPAGDFERETKSR